MYWTLSILSLFFFLMSFWFILGVLTDDLASDRKKLEYLTILTIVSSIMFVAFVAYVRRI